MRVSTAQIYQQGLSGILAQQGQLLQTQQQLATGKRVLSPSDDPASATRMLAFSEHIARTEQYLRNAGQAETRLAFEESTLAAATDIIQRVRELVIQANNATQTDSSRGAIAVEVGELQQQLLAVANTRDAHGNYLFAGHSLDTEPFAQSGGAWVYNGDQGRHFVDLGANLRLAVSHSGAEVFQGLTTPAGTADALGILGDIAAVLTIPDTGPAARAQIQGGLEDGLAGLDAALERFTNIRAELGSRLKAVDNQRALNEDYLLQVRTALSGEEDLDYAEAISRLGSQQIALEAAQQAYLRLQNLSLFNYL